jgi:hypothetical protein
MSGIMVKRLFAGVVSGRYEFGSIVKGKCVLSHFMLLQIYRAYITIIVGMHNVNQALHTLFKKDSVLHTPVKNYVIRLGQKAEKLQVRVALLQKQKKAKRRGSLS